MWYPANENQTHLIRSKGSDKHILIDNISIGKMKLGLGTQLKNSQVHITCKS